MVIILLKDLTTTTTKLILKEADNKTEALPRASKTIQGGTVHAKKQKLVLRLTKESL